MAADGSNGSYAGGNSGNNRGAVADLRRQQVPALPGELRPLRDELADWGRRAGLSEDVADALALACYEAMANVVEHAYVGTGVMDVEAVLLAAENRVRVTVSDRGGWVPLDGRASAHRGRGLPLIRRLADEAVIIPGDTGTVVQMSWTTNRN